MPTTSQRTITLVLIFLGLIAVLLVTGAFALLLDGRDVPSTVWTLIGTVVGALASLLVSTRTVAVDPPAPAAPDPTSSAKPAPVMPS